MTEEEVTRVYETYQASLLHVATNLLKNPMEAEEVVQETFLKFSLRQTPPTKLSAWLFLVTRNGCLDLLRHARCLRIYSLEYMLTEQHDEPVVERGGGELPTMLMELDQALEELHPQDAALFRLLYCTPGGPRTLEQAATLSHLSYATAKVRVHRARGRLRVLLERPLVLRRKRQ